MIESREGADRIAKSRPPGLERVGDYECHLPRIARHSCGVCIACPERTLHPCMIGAARRLNAWRTVPDLGAIRAGLDEYDVNPERLELVRDRLGPSFDRPFRSAVDRIRRLADEGGLARDDDDAPPPLRTEGRQQGARQPEYTKEVRLITLRSSDSGTSSKVPAAATPAL
jgi:hypothetical protein